MSIEQRTYEIEIAGRPLKVELGKYATLANASAMVRYGDTAVLTAVTDSGPKPGLGFFPLSVEYEEKMYAQGTIPGGYLKREGRPSEQATLSARVIDRSIRPMFPDGFKNEVQVISTVMSLDHKNTPEMSALIGASIGLSISDIPFAQPIAGVIVGYIDDEFVINPTEEQAIDSQMHLIVAGTKDGVVMVEAGANKVPDEIMMDAILFGHEEIKRIVKFIEKIAEEVGLEKREVEEAEIDETFYENVMDEMFDSIDAAMRISDKHDRGEKLDEILEEVTAKYEESLEEEELEEKTSLIKTAHKDLQKKCTRKMILEEKVRPDGRTFDEIRPLSSEVGVLPRVHGTGVFKRGLTQVLSALTLGASGEGKRLDGLEKIDQKRYMHHYNFPPYSVGETGRIRVNRRAIGHGALGERALLPVLPSDVDFPYSIRVVSEVLTCNGSSSQASICGSTLALLDAGVPIDAPVAGIAMGLMKEDDKVQVLTDIQGIEDFYGNMDFKVAGTKDGVTALQMDIKLKGLDKAILKEALMAGKKGRIEIIESMEETIAEPREELSPYAPSIIQTAIDPEKIGDIIGPGGKTITRITTEYDVKIDIEDDGSIFITANDQESGKLALKEIELITEEPEVGRIYKGTIKRIVDFGAFVEILPGKEGLCHISQFTKSRLNKVKDKFELGEEIWVKLTKIDNRGRLDLSRKEAIAEKEIDDPKEK